MAPGSSVASVHRLSYVVSGETVYIIVLQNCLYLFRKSDMFIHALLLFLMHLIFALSSAGIDLLFSILDQRNFRTDAKEVFSLFNLLCFTAIRQF